MTPRSMASAFGLLRSISTLTDCARVPASAFSKTPPNEGHRSAADLLSPSPISIVPASAASARNACRRTMSRPSPPHQPVSWVFISVTRPVVEIVQDRGVDVLLGRDRQTDMSVSVRKVSSAAATHTTARKGAFLRGITAAFSEIGFHARYAQLPAIGQGDAGQRGRGAGARGGQLGGQKGNALGAACRRIMLCTINGFLPQHLGENRLGLSASNCTGRTVQPKKERYERNDQNRCSDVGASMLNFSPCSSWAFWI